MGIITIDGNIGCGKSSILTYLHKTYKLPVDLEPVESWQSYLNNIYNNTNNNDNNSNVFNFQVRIWLDRCWIQNKKDNDFSNIILVERSPYFIKKSFIETAKNNNVINLEEYQILLDLHKKTDEKWNNNIYIYLKSEPELCLSRIKKRNRQSEDKITLEYLKQIHNTHEENIIKLKKEVGENNIYIINIENKTIQIISNEINNIINKIKK
jgi:deoxyadenosine/deoxycytidine kinase|tara:strand:+ start:86 stop:715 length:630 start_codon:yes stop_codon:yes gene_type:complete